METLRDAVQDWWNRNPYTYGLSRRESYVDVGEVPDQEINERFFDEYMGKVAKHLRDAQGSDGKICGRFIDYESVRDKTVLDIACGVGWATIEMARAGARVTGIDISPHTIEIANKHIEYRNLQSNAQVFVGDAQNLVFENNSFDCVHAWGCLMHMPETVRAITEIFRVLKPGGKAFGYMYNKNSTTYWWHIWFLRGVLMGGLVRYRGDTQRLVSRYTDGISIGGNPHTKVYTPKQTKELFEVAGFTHVDVKPWGPPELLDSFPVSTIRLGKFLSYRTKKRISDRIGWGMTFVAQKSAS